MRAFVLVLLILIPTTGLAQTGFEKFKEEVENESYRPIDVYAVEPYKEVDEWTGWNKFWFGMAIGGSIADVASTEYQLGGDSRCSEANPIFGEDPDLGLMILGKVVVMGVAWWITEYVTEEEKRQQTRNWVYGPIGVIYTGVAAHNMSLDCR